MHIYTNIEISWREKNEFFYFKAKEIDFKQDIFNTPNHIYKETLKYINFDNYTKI